MGTIRALKHDPQFGVDSKWSWISAVSCCCVLFLALATPRVSGIFFYGIVETFMHFEKRRATACSLVYTVSGLNTLVLPPLVEFFRATYGVRGAFLLYGAIMLHAIPSVIILRSPAWLLKLKRESNRATSTAVKNPTSATRLHIHEANEGNCSANIHPGESRLQVQDPTCRHEAGYFLQPQQDGETAFHFKSNTFMKKLESYNIVQRSGCGSTTKQFLTITFLVHGLSFAAVIFTTCVFVMIPADLARDRGMNPSDSVYVLQAFSVTDIAFRAIGGLTIDSRILSLESVMLLGFALQGLAFEWLVWIRTLSPMVVAAALLGATCGSRMCLQAPAMVRDFGLGTLAMMMGGLSFCTGVSLLVCPPLIGYFRDEREDYSGLLHLMAALNALFVLIWAVKMVARRRATSPPPSKPSESIQACRIDSPISSAPDSCIEAT
ncbi:hypothetical protein HPB50_027499 [Hyalomma asiaticum]|uniref:Uncharacterized protein n=1 Tax=Hyalomma asiaticum TaxID=266040 RepID=A0ACB7T9G9_HYAAI|nr:hypothetical protein HPB50_027499 [Hyalomma asiaticum]